MNTKQIADRETPPRPKTKLPKWCLEDYPGADEDIADDLFSAIYWNLRDESEKKAKENNVPFKPEEDLLIQSQLISASIMKAAEQADKGKASFDRAFVRLVYQVKQHGFYRMTKDEYNSLEEWLIDKIPALPEGSGELYSVMYILNTLLPTLEQIDGDFNPQEILKFRNSWAKAREGSSHLRYYTNQIEHVNAAYTQEITKAEKEISAKRGKIKTTKNLEEKSKLEKELKIQEKSIVELINEKKEKEEEAVKEFSVQFEKYLKAVSDTSIPAYGPNGIKKVLERGKVITYKGSKCILGNGKVAYMVIVDGAYQKAVASNLASFVEFRDTDGAMMVSELGKLVLANDGKGKQIKKKEK